MASKGIFGKKLESFITSDDILGKDVLDSQGGLVGVAEKIFIDENTLNLVGIEVDKGILHKGVTVGKGYIKKITPYAIFLKTSIVYEVKGMTVYDMNGAKVGKVKRVNLTGERNTIKSLEVRKRIGQSFMISKELIASIGSNVFLNVDKSQFEVKEEKN